MTTRKPDTIMAHGGRDPNAHHGFVNVPVHRGSTILFPSVAAWRAAKQPGSDAYVYTRIGNPNSRAFEQTVAALEGGAGAIATCSGLAALSTALSALTSAGDHILVADTVYGPGRAYCEKVLMRMGVEVEFIAPDVGTAIASRVKPNTTLVYLEAPGSHSFEMIDLPAVTNAAKAAAADPGRLRVMVDNTWGTPLFFRTFEHGIDVSVHAGTKYMVGHSDVMLGVIVANAATEPEIRRFAHLQGVCASPDDLFLGLRGLRTMGVRLREQSQRGLAIAEWLAARPEVARVRHPALPSDPGHAIWKRDFTGAASLFAIELDGRYNLAATDRFIDSLQYFGLGASWGGFESLVYPGDDLPRAVAPPQPAGRMLRFHIGLEDLDDLKDDLNQALGQMHALSQGADAAE